MRVLVILLVFSNCAIDTGKKHDCFFLMLVCINSGVLPSEDSCSFYGQSFSKGDVILSFTTADKCTTISWVCKENDSGSAEVEIKEEGFCTCQGEQISNEYGKQLCFT